MLQCVGSRCQLKSNGSIPSAAIRAYEAPVMTFGRGRVLIVQFEQIEQALQAPVMDAVIALVKSSNLENNPEGRITAYRAIDQTLSLGYSNNINAVIDQLCERDFVLIASRRYTPGAEVALLTLKEIGIASGYNENCFSASRTR